MRFGKLWGLQNSTLGTTSCAPVLDAIVGKGVFAQCAAAMGDASLVSFHNLCVFDVCNNVNYCELLNEFARRCQRALKGRTVVSTGPAPFLITLRRILEEWQNKKQIKINK